MSTGGDPGIEIVPWNVPSVSPPTPVAASAKRPTVKVPVAPANRPVDQPAVAENVGVGIAIGVGMPMPRRSGTGAVAIRSFSSAMAPGSTTR